jgi:hypothetical protein
LDYEAQELRVVGIDLVGNRPADPVALNLIVDNVAPLITATHIVTSTPFTQSFDVLTGKIFDGSLDAGGKGLQLSALIEGPNKTYHESISMQGTNWSYALQPSVPGTYRISVTAYDGAGNTSTVGPYVVDVNPWHQVYFPLVAKRFFEAPDLVVDRIHAGPHGVQVVIANQGNAPVSDSFWVDLYVDPTVRPFEVNETWDQVGTQGAAWGVITPLQAGEALTLTIGDAYYKAAYSRLSWPLVVGTSIYAQVDSAGGSTFGGVQEDHETIGWGYNNILGTKVTAATTAYYADLRVYRIWDLDDDQGLPGRR